MVILVDVKAMHIEEVENVVIIDLGKITQTSDTRRQPNDSRIVNPSNQYGRV